MPITPTTVFIPVNGVMFPKVDITQAPEFNDDIAFGADLSFNMWIYRPDLVNPSNPPVWATPTTDELIENVPNYIDNNEKSFQLLSTNTLTPVLQSFKLIKRNVAFVFTSNAFWTDGQDIEKTFESDTINYTPSHDLYANTLYTVQIK